MLQLERRDVHILVDANEAERLDKWAMELKGKKVDEIHILTRKLREVRYVFDNANGMTEFKKGIKPNFGSAAWVLAD